MSLLNALHAPRHIVGFGLYWGWVALVFYGTALVGSAEGPAVESFWSLTTWVHAVALAAAALFAGRLDGPLATRAAAGVSAAGMALGSVCLAAGAGCGWDALPVAGAVVAGVSSIAQLLGWGRAFARLPQRHVAAASVAAFACGLAAYFVVTLVPLAPVRAVAVVLMPVASSALLAAEPAACPDGGGEQFPSDAGRPARWSDAAVLLVALFVFALCGELLRTFSTELSGASVDTMGALYLGGGLAGLAALGALCAVRAQTQGRPAVDVATVRNVLVAMAVAFVCVPFVGSWSYAACYAVYGAGFWCLRALVWLYGACHVRSFGASWVLVFSVLDLPFAFGVVVSAPVGSLVLQTVTLDSSQVAVVALVAVFALMFLALLVPANRQASELLEADGGPACTPPSPEVPQAEEPRPPASEKNVFEGRCGLTAREAEVALLLAQGRSLPFVQEALCISAGTAQTHARHIYKKLGIHTRQELVDVLAAAPDAAAGNCAE